jgi:hypothetical protein
MELLQSLLESSSKEQLLKLQQRFIDDAPDSVKVKIVPVDKAFKHWARSDHDEDAQRRVRELGFDAIVQVQLGHHLRSYLPLRDKSLYSVSNSRVEVASYDEALARLIDGSTPIKSW